MACQFGSRYRPISAEMTAAVREQCPRYGENVVLPMALDLHDVLQRMETFTTTPLKTHAGQPALRLLLHRWLVEYNPLYLLSAALVLGGLTLISEDAVGQTGLWGSLGIAAIAELYALALIGAAAFLVRIGRPRPAAMLALLAVLYQGDLTLHVETCAYLDGVGKVAASVWVLLFAAKLMLLAWALRLRLSRSAIAVATTTAVGLAAMPHVLRAVVDPSARATIVCLWLFSVGASALWTSRAIEGAVAWDARARRCTRAAWVSSGVLVVAHASYWAWSFHFDLSMAAVGFALLTVRWARRERRVWATVATMLTATLLVAPERFWLAALMGSVSLLLTAARTKWLHTRATPPLRYAPPYRSVEALPPTAPVATLQIDPRGSARLWIGAATAAYLAAWTTSWHGGELPEHTLWLDAVVATLCIATAFATRRPLLATPVVPMLLHFAAQLGWIPKPATATDWGVLLIGGGFVALFASVLLSWYLGRVGTTGSGTPGAVEPSRPP